ncbi:MAG: hypothetical protein ABDH91_07300 [Bacteroidia bacterium]
MRLFALGWVGVLLWAQSEPVGLAFSLRVHSGVGVGTFGKLPNDLKAANALGSEFRMSPWATTAGAGVEVLIAKKFLLGGGFQLQHYDASETERGLARPYALHYGGYAGYALVNRDLWLFYPYVGYFAGKYELRYTNYFTENIFFGRNQELEPLERRVYSSNLGMVELGLALRRWRQDQGFSLMWGVDLGGFWGVGGGSWSPSEGPAPEGVNPPRWAGAYLRFSVGFSYLKPSAASETTSPIPAVPQEGQKKKKKKKKKEASEGEQ